MQHTHTYKTVTGCVEAKKLLSRQRQSNYSTVLTRNLHPRSQVCQRNLKGGIGSFLTPALRLWNGHIDRHIWRWVIVPSDFAQSFGAICAHYHYYMIHRAITHMRAWLSLPGKGNSRLTKLLCGLSYKKNPELQNSPPYLMIRWPPQQIPPLNFLGSAPPPPLITLVDDIVALSCTCHCYPEWHNLSVYLNRDHAFKLLLLTWKAINGPAPSYISNLLVPYKPVRALRSSDKHLLTVPRTSSTLGDCAFSVAAPTLWNSLPLDIRCCDSLQSFKTLLKTHLYNKVYNW